MIAEMIGSRIAGLRMLPRQSAIRSRAWCFSLGTDTRFIDGPAAAEFLRAGHAGSRSSTRAASAPLRSAQNAIGLRYSLSQRFDGYNISIGKPVSLTVFRSQANQ